MSEAVMLDDKFQAAMAHHQAARVEQAAALYQAILEADPDHADSLHLLGLITVEHGDARAGIALIQRAMEIEPGCAPHYNSLGHGYKRFGRLEDAAIAYQAGVALRPESPELHSNLATALHDLGQHEAAVTHYRHAIVLAPEVADLWYNLANAEVGHGPAEEIEACYRQAIRLRPDHANAQANYGRWLMGQNRWPDAEVRLSDAVRLAPGNAAVWCNLGVASQELGRPAAERFFRTALAIEPGLADAHYNLGCLLSGQGQTDAAIASHKAALSVDPSHAAARLAACMAQLPILYHTEAEVAERRDRYIAALAELVAGGPSGLAPAIGLSQPFFLPYQGQEDRALQAQYGQFICDVLAAAEPPVRLAGAPGPQDRIRVGIVSGFFRDHTVFKLFIEGWLANLDRSRFEVIGFHTGSVADARTAWCGRLCDRFVQDLRSGDAWRAAIAAEAPHALLYPEVGIDPMAARLAAMRLAPVQCAAWGQPVTTGLPTMDYFLSSDLMEPDGAEASYTERLVRLPGLGLCYLTDKMGPASPSAPNEAPVFWSGQALYKYLPEYDWIYPAIAARLGACSFIFIAFSKSQNVTDGFMARLGGAFAAVGLDAAAHVVMLPAMSQDAYIQAVRQADVILDTPGWSGGKSMMNCLELDPAIVTLPGRFMRGRHTAAILRRIGCEATIAGSPEDYVSIAVRLGQDPAWRAELRAAVAAAKHAAYDDLIYMRALESFLATAVGAIE